MLVMHIHNCNLGEKGGGSVAITYRIGTYTIFIIGTYLHITYIYTHTFIHSHIHAYSRTPMLTYHILKLSNYVAFFCALQLLGFLFILL
jgi:hypothetical protein